MKLPEPLHLELTDNEWPDTGITHDRQIVRAIVYDDDGIGYSVIRADVIEKLPTLTPNAKTGHWIDIGDSEKCSACNGTLLKEFHTFNGKEIWVKANFCPICGSYNGGDEG